MFQTLVIYAIVRIHEIVGRSSKKVKSVEATAEYGETIVAE